MPDLVRGGAVMGAVAVVGIVELDERGVLGAEVVDAWQALAGDAWPVAISQQQAPTFSLSAANAWLLRRAGVLPARIDVSTVCTRCDSNGERWFSHRGQGAATGRFGALITILDD